ncbi:2-oxoglutarate dehydrogenase complex dihydrolipoyllysine-residue succinyltransferase [Immundisolibacter sp.]|uniref:2-oxoglutarate dehydrogenase complex dihydrolipoyllysine-residue succinyltransferase n=1 Tax=Immundisolibacter sp. TaxID=1934948 RepID=UPI002B0CC1DB|nr:2-oxoglutarate dehydrogenase complex dihydrolipoyllysine-residue succinyltransferase [Immundisolibacter sp.]MEA3219000.1 Dihydrolipoyllysine-residue succinyltransferase component of 2-oxoglutarate dehydrogenase complex [Immundisolibacter sp.]
MQLEIKVPVLPESVAEATLLQWRKQPGDAVRRDENLIDVETDKVVLEVVAPADGVLTAIHQPGGATVHSGELLATLDTSATAPIAGAVAAAPDMAPQPQPVAEIRPAAGSAAASPAARKLAVEQGVETATLSGSGRDGRVIKEDVLAAVAQRAPTATAEVAAQPAAERPEQRVPMTRIRQRIAERLVEAQRTAAILTTFNEVNMQPVMDLRARHREAFEKIHGVKLGFMSFFVRAAVEALKKFPLVNASIDGSDVVYHGYFDIGIAVSSPRGLVVPTLRDAGQMSFADIEKAIADFGRRAGENKLTLEELSGGTFSITNGGIFGSMLSTPILNPPQSAILGMHNIVERPVVEHGQVVVRPIMYLALSYDHRLIDGREAVQFLVAIKQSLEDPARLLLGL